MKIHTTKSESETKKLAAKFAKKLKGGEVVELIGELGSGKTTFVRGAVEALGSKVRVKSPTFTILNEYPVEHQKIKMVAHLDLYRFDYAQQLEALALDDYQRPDVVLFIEWPEIIEQAPLEATHRIRFEIVDEDTRKITL